MQQSIIGWGCQTTHKMTSSIKTTVLLVDLALCFNPLYRLKDQLYTLMLRFTISVFSILMDTPTLNVKNMSSYQGQGNPVVVGVGGWTSPFGCIYTSLSSHSLCSQPPTSFHDVVEIHRHTHSYVHLPSDLATSSSLSCERLISIMANPRRAS